MTKEESVYVGYIHSVKEHFYHHETKDKKSYFEKIKIKTKNKEGIIIYRDIITSVLYYSEQDIKQINFESKYITNVRKLERKK